MGGWGALSQVPTEPPRKSDTLLMNMGVSGLTGPWVGSHICTNPHTNTHYNSTTLWLGVNKANRQHNFGAT